MSGYDDRADGSGGCALGESHGAAAVRSRLVAGLGCARLSVETVGVGVTVGVVVVRRGLLGIGWRLIVDKSAVGGGEVFGILITSGCILVCKVA